MTEQEWIVSEDPVAMLHCLTGSAQGHHYFPTSRKLRLFACACARQVWHLLTDDVPCPDAQCKGRGRWRIMGLPATCPVCKGEGRISRSRRAVEVAEQYADGQTTQTALIAAWEAAQDAVEQDVPYAALVHWVAPMLGNPLADSVRELLHALAIVDEVDYRQIQATLLRCVVGNPFRPVALERKQPRCPHCGSQQWATESVTTQWCKECHAQWEWPTDAYTCLWLTPTVVSLAQAAYDERPGRQCEACKGTSKKTPDTVAAIALLRAFPDDEKTQRTFLPDCDNCHGVGRIDDGTLDPARLAVLADALEEAGCTDTAILMHLRGLAPCGRCQGKGRYDTMVDAGYGNPLMRQPGWQWCYQCNAGGLGVTPGWTSPRGGLVHVRGCWVVDCILGKE